MFTAAKIRKFFQSNKFSGKYTTTMKAIAIKDGESSEATTILLPFIKRLQLKKKKVQGE